jgi:hypothetical protein
MLSVPLVQVCSLYANPLMRHHSAHRQNWCGSIVFLRTFGDFERFLAGVSVGGAI